MFMSIVQVSFNTDHQTRSDYFKTTLNQQRKVVQVNECNQLVLATAIDFMYGANIPNELALPDAKSLLAMADLYKMVDLKDAVAPLIGNQLNMENIQEISLLAEKHTAQKLKELCCDFILTDIDKLNLNSLNGSFPVLTVLGKAYLEKQRRCLNFANKLLGTDLTQMGHFKKRDDFKADSDYEAYVKANMKENMIVICNQDFQSNYYSFTVKKGSLGRITTRADYYGRGEVGVKWQGQSNGSRFPYRIFDLLTRPPCLV